MQPIVELMDSKIVKLIDLFSNNPDKQFYLRQVSRLTGISPATTFRLLNQLLKKEIIKQITINRFKLYQLNDNEKGKQIAELFSRKKNAIEMFISMIRDIKEIEQVYSLDSRSTKDKLNVLIIGQNIDSTALKRIVVKIKEDFNFTINYLSLTFDQYSNMLSMGLFPGKKTLLYEKK